MIAIIDYGLGNLKSVRNALRYCGLDCAITANPEEIAKSERIILPGVGAFGEAMTNLRSLGLDAIIKREAAAGKPLLGICLGMQLLAKTGFEFGEHEGLGLIPGQTVPMRVSGPGVKLPHVGWNDTTYREHPLFAGLPSPAAFYFVHGFHLSCSRAGDVLAVSDHGGEFTAAVCSANVAGVQFHPEKSQDNGIQLLENFAEWRP